MSAAGGVLALLLGLQAASPAAAPDQRDKAVGLAGVFIIDGCLFRLDAANSASDYGAGSATLAKNFKDKYPEMAAEPVDVDGGPKGDSCRVTYHGPRVAELWTLFDKPPGTCATSKAGETDIAMTCPASKESVGYTMTLHRSGDGAAGLFSDTFTWTAPKLP